MDQPDLFSLPLFPLGTVLYPGIVLPLTIFEERYKAMIKYCMDEESHFGVVLIAKGKEVGDLAEPHDIGTMAKIVQIQHLNDKGEMAVFAVGTQRFKIWDHVISTDGYLVGTVSEINNQEAEIPFAAEIVGKARDTLTTYLNLTYSSDEEMMQTLDTKLSTDPEALSFQIAAILNVDLKTKQDLLETEQAVDRLEHEIKILNADIDASKRKIGPKTFKIPGGGEVNLN